MAKTYIGGSFAPPLDAAKLAEYKALAAAAEEKVREGMTALIKMVETFRETPASTQTGKPHPSGRGLVVPLDEAEVKRIWDVVPWQEELDLYAGWFDKIDPVKLKPLRDAAFHLLWYGRELFLDREPMTADRL